MGRLSSAQSNLGQPKRLKIELLNADHDVDPIPQAEEEPSMVILSEEVENVFNPINIYPLRENYIGPCFPLKTSSGPRAQLSDEARSQAVFDLMWLYDKNKTEQINQAEDERKFVKKASKSSPAKLKRALKLFLSRPKRNGALKNGEMQRMVADHYQICVSTLKKIMQRQKTHLGVEKMKQPGRKPVQTKQTRRIVRQTINKNRGMALRKLAMKLQGKVEWATMYKGKTHSSPHYSTLCHMRKRYFQPHMVRKRPFLSEKAIEERKVFAPAALVWTLPFECRDEAYFEVKQANDMRYYVSVDEDEGEDGDEVGGLGVFYDNGGDKHNAKVFVLGVVTMPGFTLNAEGKVESFDTLKNGKILLARVRGFHLRQRGEFKPGTREYVEGKKPGDKIFSNTTINSQRYYQLHFMPNGIVDSIKQYNNPSLRPADYKTARVLALDENAQDKLSASQIAELEAPFNAEDYPATFINQEDGAPGHGFNNLQGGKTNIFHDLLSLQLAKQGFQLVKQSRHSPEFNALDLGVWSIIKAEVEARWEEIPQHTGQGSNVNEVESAIWNIVKNAWENKVTPRHLFNIFKQREEMLKECIRLEGKSIVKEPHTGIRKKYGTESPKGEE